MRAWFYPKQLIRGSTLGDNALSIQSDTDLPSAEVRQFCELDETSRTLMRCAMSQLQISTRAYHRLLKQARTIADLAASEHIRPAKLARHCSIGQN
jgi:predicted ATPase with chaperone activity